MRNPGGEIFRGVSGVPGRHTIITEHMLKSFEEQRKVIVVTIQKMRYTLKEVKDTYHTRRYTSWKKH